MPPKNSDKDRRRHPRAGVALPVQLYDAAFQRRITSGVTVNVSAGGLLAECAEVAEAILGEVVRVHLAPRWAEFDQTNGVFRARVLRTQEGDALRLAAEVLGTPPAFLLAPEFVGLHPNIVTVKQQLMAVAQYDVNLLVRGESGTGKNVVAELVHRYSARSEAAFIQVNCPAIPETLLESQLFGHEKGAFTDARTARPGLFRTADGGTVVLDEISAIPPGVQAKLLQVIETKSFIPVGGHEAVRADVRIVATANNCLERHLGDGAFREDLYYRLNEVEVVLPPLRERRSDIPLLANHFHRLYCRQFGKEHSPLEPELIRMFQAYDWPGNVRELQNVIKRGVIMGEFEPREMPGRRQNGQSPPAQAEPMTMERARQEAEREALVRALEVADGHRGQAAEELGVSYRTLLRRMKKYAIEV